MITPFMQERMNYILNGRPLSEKKVQPIRKESLKRQAKKRAQAKEKNTLPMDQFWDDARKLMTGTCQCGCGHTSQKDKDDFFKHCICHIFPQRLFPSICNHPLNWVERTFWLGHHTNMDDQSLDKWPMMADWDDIKAKFHQLTPLLTDAERAQKFYSHLERLVNEN